MVGMQEVIRRLSSFWQERGCALLPPCPFPVPMGLLHPETFFRLLEPGPWHGAFLQSISRPADGRDGRHPHRAARHHQLQVVLQDVAPAEPRDAALESLEVLGLSPRDHDLRFTEAELEVYALGALGRGWQVSFDGLEVVRVTFLYRLGDRPPARPTAEIAYGIERLTLLLDGVPDLAAVTWRGRPPGEHKEPPREKRREHEQELYRYHSEVANVGYLRQVIDGLDREADRALDAGLPQVAYELAVSALPILDRLDTRGDLTTAERSHWLGEIRARVSRAADLYQAKHGLPPGGEEVTDA